jgi:hypothetical protein
MNELTTSMTIYDAAPPAILKSRRSSKDYTLDICGREVHLERDADFGKIPGTKTPTLYKAGAEKIVWNYGITTKYELEQAIEDYEKGFFFYRFRCELWKGDMLITMGYGSSNSKEKKNGSASGFDVANTCLKIAKKRALVDGAILLGQLSSIFTQDIENDNYTESASALFGNKDPNKPITAEQVKYFYTIATRNGISKQEAKEFLASHSISSAKDIKTGEFDDLCEELRQIGG